MRVKRGDTIVEVAFSIAIFSLVAVLSIMLMNSGLATAQASLEVTMARNEINAQAEAIRFVHNSFSLERELHAKQQDYRDLWYRLSRDSDAFEGGMVNRAENVPELSVDSCSQIYDGGNKSIIGNNKLTAFVVDFRAIDPKDTSFENDNLKEIVVSTKNAESRFGETVVNPRVLFSRTAPNASTDTSNENSDQMFETFDYRYVSRAEGIWVIATRDETRRDSDGVIDAIPEFYDFHIYTCWIAPGKNRPSTIGTIVRLYNPELVEGL